MVFMESSTKLKPGSKPTSRILAIPDELVEPLREQMRSIEGPHVFRRYVSLRRDFEVILRRAGIPKKDELGRKVTSHSFRHTYATLMAEQIGNNQLLLMKLLGHKQISTTTRYCHPTAPLVRLNLKSRVSGSCKVVEVQAAESA